MPTRLPRYGARLNFSSSSGLRKSPHADWYSQILPSMLPIAILGSSVYLGLHLIQTTLAREHYADHATARIKALETELTILRQQKAQLPQTHIRRWWFF